MVRNIVILALGMLARAAVAEPAGELPTEPALTEEAPPSAGEFSGGAAQEKEDDGADAIGELIPWSRELLVFPEWNSDERLPAGGTGMPEAGGGLFPPEIWPPLTYAPDDNSAGTGAPARLRDRAAGIDVLAARGDAAPGQALHDPAGLLPPERRAEMTDLARRWLNEQCGFRTVLVLLPAETGMPPDFDPVSLHRQWFGAAENDSPNNGLMILYFYGSPQRAQGVFSPSARETYGAERLRAALDLSVSAAARAGAGEPLEQLERFCQAMTIDLHRMVKEGPRHASLGGGSGAGRGRMGWVLSLCGILAAAAGGAAVWRHRRRLRERDAATPILLPEMDYTPRLGAPHCGGFSAVMIYDSPGKTVPTENLAVSSPTNP